MPSYVVLYRVELTAGHDVRAGKSKTHRSMIITFLLKTHMNLQRNQQSYITAMIRELLMMIYIM